jgi:hypothetical protein
METLKYALVRQWGFILLAVLSVVIYFIAILPTWVLAPVSIIIILVNERMKVKRSHQQKGLQIALRFHELAQDFQKRFVRTGSAYSIFYLINELGNAKSDKQEMLKEWARGCSHGHDFLDDEIDLFIGSLNVVVENKARQQKELSERCKEFKRINHLYYKLVEVFYERAKSGNIPKYLENRYNEFVTEYNEFVRFFRDIMGEANDVLHLNIDPKSIDFAKESHLVRYS